jgi:ficolin
MKFTTKDKDNDQGKGKNCAVENRGGWWYKNCHYSNLNGLYLEAKATLDQGMGWYQWKNDRRCMKKTEMKIRPA